MQNTLKDRDYGWIVLILRNGFVFVGSTVRTNGVGILSGFQVRYWAAREGGLPELAAKGRIKDDKLDPVVLEFPWSEHNVIGTITCNQEAWKNAV